MAISMGAYVVAWQYGNKRGQRKEAERVEALRASGWLNEKQGESESDEKNEGTKPYNDNNENGISTM